MGRCRVERRRAGRRRHDARRVGRRRCRTGILPRVGFDSTRKHRRSNFDYWFVASGLIVCVALVVWALFG